MWELLGSLIEAVGGMLDLFHEPNPKNQSISEWFFQKARKTQKSKRFFQKAKKADSDSGSDSESENDIDTVCNRDM